MAFFNYSTMQMTAKIVYYGPGLCGKTTNLQYIYGHTEGESRGEMVSLETQTDRTLFFDLLPLDVGSVAGFRTKIQLYTVPGQVFYNTTRKLVLKGVDGVVFVADSQLPMLQSNVESFANLGENLEELGLDVHQVPLVLQYNKRDLPEVQTLEQLENSLNTGNWESYEASALTGQGVFETLRGISRLTLLSLRDQLEMTASGTLAPGAAPSAPAAPKPKPEPAPAAAAEVAPSPASDPELKESPEPTTEQAAAPPQPEPSSPFASPSSASPAVGAAVAATEASPDNAGATAVATPERTKPLRKDLLLRLPAADFARTKRLGVRLTLEDAEGKVVRVTRDVQIALDPRSDEEALVSLNLALRSDG